MTDASSLVPIVAIVDLAVILLVVGMFIYALARGLLRLELWPTTGGRLIVGGMVLAVGAVVSDVNYGLLHPFGVYTSDMAESSYFSPAWLLSRMAFAMVSAGLLVSVLARKRASRKYLEAERELEVSKYFEYQAEERFRYLFDSTSNSVYCYRFDPPMPVDLPIPEQIQRSYDAVLQECNVMFARELGADDPSEVIGSRMGELESAKDPASHEAYFRTFVESDYRLDGYDFDYRAPTGESRALHVNMVGIIRDGLLHRMWAVENNTLDLQQTKAALRRRRRFQELVASVSSRLVMASDAEADQVIEACMKDVCEFVVADRSTMFWLEVESNSARVAYIWSPENDPFGPVSLDQFPRFAAQLRAFKPVRIDNVDNLPENYAVDKVSLVQFGVKSILVVPMVVESETVGGMTCGRLKKQQDWTDQDVADVTMLAELFASFVFRLKSRRALSDALAQLQEATDRLEAENVYLRQEIELTHGFDEIVGRSDAVLRSLKLVEQVAPTKTPVLIVGETGTGKELVARAIHELSDRCDRPLVKVNCAALPANLIESELFGHEKGAFTGADHAKRGRFDLAHGSTLFLDEIGEIPIELQSKLLRVLQEGEFDRLGGGETTKVDVRIIVATNRDLADAVQAGKFRSDLYYRINTFPIEMPPLRDRGNDIELLAQHFVAMHAPRLGREVTEMSAEMMKQLRHYHWPGNVRELEGIVQRALISSRGPVVNLAEPLTTELQGDERSIGMNTGSDLKLVERDHIVAVLEGADWKIAGATGAASKLGIPPSTLRSKMKKLSIARPS